MPPCTPHARCDSVKIVVMVGLVLQVQMSTSALEHPLSRNLWIALRHCYLVEVIHHVAVKVMNGKVRNKRFEITVVAISFDG